MKAILPWPDGPSVPSIVPHINPLGTRPSALHGQLEHLWEASEILREAFRHAAPQPCDYDTDETFKAAEKRHRDRLEWIDQLQLDIDESGDKISDHEDALKRLVSRESVTA